MNIQVSEDSDIQRSTFSIQFKDSILFRNVIKFLLDVLGRSLRLPERPSVKYNKPFTPDLLPCILSQIRFSNSPVM